MGYLIPVTPQAFVNRISIFGPDEANIKGMRLLIILTFNYSY